MLLTALIVTNRQRFFNICKNAFYENNAYMRVLHGDASDVKNKKKRLDAERPDIILVDAVSGEDAIELMVYMKEQALGYRPALFICLDERIPNWEKMFLRRGAMYVFERNMPEHIIVECVMNIYNMHCSFGAEDKITPELVRVLRECHISPRHRGYACISECVRMMFRQYDYGQLLTKDIYPQVAEKLGTSPIGVEKNIRDAIRGGWESGGKVIFPSLLGCGREKQPTNGEFISCVCEKLMEVIYDKERMERGALSI